MSQNDPFFYREGQPPNYNSPSQAPPPAFAQQPAPANVAPTMQAQQSAFQQNAALPSDTMQQLAAMNITPEQFMQIAQMIQSGAVPITPAATTPSQPQAQPQVEPAVARSKTPPWLASCTPSQSQPQSQPQLQTQAPATRSKTAPWKTPNPVIVGEDEMDIEDAEVEEDNDWEDMKEPNVPRKFLKTPPNGPRKRSRSPEWRFDTTRRPSQHRVRSPVNSVAGGRRPSALGYGSVHAGTHPSDFAAEKTLKPIEDKEAAAKNFVLALCKEGYLYNDVAKFITRKVTLHRLWTSLGLPFPDSVTNASNQPDVQEFPKAPAKRAAATKASAPQDRSAYLAKLQAAKNKKPEAPAVSQASSEAKSALATAEQPSPSTQTPNLVPSAPCPSSKPVKRAIDNKLVRQRLEALKAANAKKAAEEEAKKAALSAAAPNSDLEGNESVPINGFAARDGQKMPHAAVSPNFNGPTALPGLLASGVAAVPSPTQTQPLTTHYQQPGNHAQAISSGRSAATSGNNTPKRPFGMSRGSSHDDRVIIIDSDGESDGGVDATADVVEVKEVRRNPFDAFPPMSEAEKEQKLARLAEAKKELAEMEKKRDERRKNKKMATINTGATPSASVSASEAGTPAGDQTLTAPSGITAPLVEAATLIAQEQKPYPAQQALAAGAPETEDAQMEATSADGTPNSWQDMYERSSDENDQPTDDKQAHEESNSDMIRPVATGIDADELNGMDALQNGGGKDPNANPQVTTLAEDASSPKPSAAFQQRDGEGEMDVDDDDDMDDLYDDPVALAQPVGPAATASQAVSDGEEYEDEEDDTGSAMSLTDEDSEELNRFYRLTDTDKQLPADAMPLPKPSPPAMPTPPEASPLESNGPDTSGLDTNGDVLQAAQHDFQSDDGLAAELQPAQGELAAPETQPASSGALTPYVSPLASFKDFRYHPEFLATVPGGFKSLTYNHKIDADKVVCRFETAGGICNDKTCEFQHFRDMSLSDNDLLKKMGADEIPAKDPEDVKRWRAGLAAIISEIRTSNQSRDVGTISRRIAEFRRTFLGDPSNILRLNVEL